MIKLKKIYSIKKNKKHPQSTSYKPNKSLPLISKEKKII